MEVIHESIGGKELSKGLLKRGDFSQAMSVHTHRLRFRRNPLDRLAHVLFLPAK
jgi:hypothetical protein